MSVSSGGGHHRALDRRGGLVGGGAVEEPVEVGAGEAPVERCRGGVVAILEGEDPLGEGVEIGQVVGGQHLALEDGEEDLYLVQPRRMYRQVHQLRGRPRLLIRVTEARPRWEDPLSTIQNTRSALA